ncbi:MAG: primase-helicase family protein, partial [Bacteroidales bacterium]
MQTNSYFVQRLEKLGISEADNKIKASDRDGHSYESCYFKEAPEGIQINYFSPSGFVCKYENGSGKLFDYSRIRLAEPKENKYKQPYHSEVIPFITPSIIEKFKNKTSIDTLIIVEGEFKAFAGHLAGFNIIGIGGIHNYTESKTKELHSYIVHIIEVCKVKNLILLFDADCISENYIKENLDKDLHTRLYSFYSAAKKFRELCKELNVDVYFAHINNEFETKAKGLDDLLCCFNDKKKNIVKDLLKLEKAKEYFYCLNITDNSLNKLYSHFLLDTDKLGKPLKFHEKFKTIIENNEFLFKGISFQFDENELKLIKHPRAADYLRVKTDYYFKGYRVTSKGERVSEIVFWKKGTIREDYGKIPDFFSMIPKYVNFCNVPDNTETFRQTVERCYNLYEKILHIPKENTTEKDFQSTINFLKHIFQEKYDVALDYLTLLYRYPTRNLPIICLVSKENETGKTKFLQWLKEIFGNNAIILGNEDFDSRFNSHWASKLIVGIDESFIDKRLIKEKIKRLCTDNSINFEAKSKD